MKEKKYLYVIAREMPCVNADEYVITRRGRDMNRDAIIHELLVSPVDELYTDVYDENFILPVLQMGIVVYFPEHYARSFPVNRFGRTVYQMGGVPKNSAWEAVNRGMDIAISLVGLVVTALVFPAVSVLIYRETKASPIYVQTRIGENGRHFRLYKFRSMRKTADQEKAALLSRNEMDGHMFKIEHDPRITKIGAFLRKTSLDEFPQFVNVLRGDMSVIGTRPPLPEEVEMYLPEHKRRLARKPGITGVWQTHGRNGVKCFDDVVRMDLAYLTRPTPARYLYLAFATAMKIFLKKGDGQ